MKIKADLYGGVKLLPGGVQVQPGRLHLRPQSRVLLLRFLPKLENFLIISCFGWKVILDGYLLIVNLTTTIGLEVALQWTCLMGVMRWGCTVLN